jgi:hypothetical protein
MHRRPNATVFMEVSTKLGNLWRRLMLATRVDGRSLTSLQQRLVKTHGRHVKRALLTGCCWRPVTLRVRLFGDASAAYCRCPGG